MSKLTKEKTLFVQKRVMVLSARCCGIPLEGPAAVHSISGRKKRYPCIRQINKEEKEVYMKRVFVGLFLSFLSLIFLSHNLHAEMYDPIGNPERGCQDEGIHMMPAPMRPPGIGIMEGIPEADHLMWKHVTGLGLDEKQREAIKEIKSKVIKETIKKSADSQVAHIELKDLLDKDPVNMKAVEAKLKQIEIIKTEMHLSLIRAVEEVKSKLTPEQRKKFKEMLEMEPGMGPPMMGGVMHSGTRMPPPPCEKKEDMQPPREHSFIK
jgi:Spy/CpxP family protein refolding chaperone